MTNFIIKGIAPDTENATVNTTKPGKGPQSDLTTVSYTHLTLPTIYPV